MQQTMATFLSKPITIPNVLQAANTTKALPPEQLQGSSLNTQSSHSDEAALLGQIPGVL